MEQPRRGRTATRRPEEKCRIVDLSMPLASLKSPVWPGAPLPVRSMFLDHSEGGFRSYVWSFEEHTATHVDAPLHIQPAGKSVDGVELSRFVGEGAAVDVSDLPPKGLIERGLLEGRIRREGYVSLTDHILLIHTGYSKKFGTREWLENPVLGAAACRGLLRLGVKGVGIDAASPDREPFPAHRTLLPAGVSLYENLANLDQIIGRRFTFVGAPIRLVGGTAGLARAFALVPS